MTGGATVLVTGAAGFIGSHTSEALLARGYRVVGLDSFHDYYSPDRKRANLHEVAAHPRARQYVSVEGDVRDVSLLEQLAQQHRFAAVVHLAAMAGVRASLEDPHLYVDVNLNGSLNLLNLCRDHRIPTLVFASTSSVYGNSTAVPFSESESCDRPLAPYAASKRAAEMMAYTYHHLFGLDCTVLRFFTVYGPRGRPDMLPYKLLEHLYRGLPLQLFNRGEMWRDWTFVEDIAEGVAQAVERPLGYEVINLGRGEMVKLADFVALCEELTGRPSHPDFVPKAAADIDRSLASIEKAHRLLDYRPAVGVAQGIERTVDWYRRAVLRGEP